MPYEFPKHVLKNSEVLDPDNLTLEVAPAAEQLSGNLGATNFSGLNTNINPLLADSGAFGSCKFTSRVGSNDFRIYGIGNGGTTEPTQPQGPVLFAEKSGWQTVCVVDQGYVTETSRLWLSGIGQHLWYAFTLPLEDRDGIIGRTPFPGHHYQYGDFNIDEAWPSPRTTGLTSYPRKSYGAMVQWALRVNGRVIDDSVTGCHDDQQQGIVPIQLKTERLADDERVQFPGPSGEKTPQRSALGTAAWPCRLGTIVDISPGNCVVELVVRRLDDDRFSKQYGNRVEHNKVGVMNASLNVITLPTRVGSPVSSESVNSPPFIDQELFNPGDSISSAASALSALRKGNIAPGAFRPEHMMGGPIVSFDQIGLHAKTEYGYSGFTYHNRRPDSEFIARAWLGESDYNPHTPKITWDHKEGYPATGATKDTSGWCMWAVRSHNEERLNYSDSLLTDHDESSVSPIVTSTNHSIATQVVPNLSSLWREKDQGFCALRSEFAYKANRNRALLITADVQVLLLHGHRHAFASKDGSVDFVSLTKSAPDKTGGSGGSSFIPDTGGTSFIPNSGVSSFINFDGASAAGSSPGGFYHKLVVESQQTKRAYSNAGVFGFFRLGFHIKGQSDSDWVIPPRSEVFVNQFNNWREHPTLETDSEFRDARPLANQVNLSLQMMVSRPWLDWTYWDYAPGGAKENTTSLGHMQESSQNMVIDGVALFVAGAETNTFYGPTVGLSGANLSAMLIDFGHTDSVVPTFTTLVAAVSSE